MAEQTGSSSLPGLSNARLPTLNAQARRRDIDFAGLRALATMGTVLDILEWTAVSRRGAQLRGPCPIHRSESSHSRSFSVSLEKNAFRCFGCGKRGNQLDLFAEAVKLPLYAAAAELCRRMRIEPPRLNR